MFTAGKNRKPANKKIVSFKTIFRLHRRRCSVSEFRQLPKGGKDEGRKDVFKEYEIARASIFF